MTSAQLLIAAGGIVTFAFLGVIQSLYGPLVPGFQQEFGVSTGTAGLVFTAHGAGALLGILAPSYLRAARFTAHWLGVATALLLVGATALSLAPNWLSMLAAAFVLATGFGIHVVRLNSLFVAGFKHRSMAMSQLINAAFSIGAILGPVVLGLSGAPSRRIFLGLALFALILLPLSAATDRMARAIVPRSPEHASDASSPNSSHGTLVAFVALMCLIVGAENAIGGWTTTLALAKGYSFAQAANLTALFFGAILAGRLLAAALGHRVPASTLVLAAVIGMVVLLFLATATRIGPVAFALTGFAIAPIFSATLLWAGKTLPGAAHAYAFVIGGALLGSAVFPALVGRAIGEWGAAAAPPAVLCLTLAALLVAVWLHAANRGG